MFLPEPGLGLFILAMDHDVMGMDHITTCSTAILLQKSRYMLAEVFKHG